MEQTDATVVVVFLSKLTEASSVRTPAVQRKDDDQWRKMI